MSSHDDGVNHLDQMRQMIGCGSVSGSQKLFEILETLYATKYFLITTIIEVILYSTIYYSNIPADSSEDFHHLWMEEL